MPNSSVFILIVEDDPLIRQDLECILGEAGFGVVAAASAEGALGILGTRGGEVRAVVTDINLTPGKLKGWDVARRARELHPRMPIIYVTGQGREEWASMGVPDSVLVTKPFAPTQLTTAISQLLNDATHYGSD